MSHSFDTVKNLFGAPSSVASLDGKVMLQRSESVSHGYQVVVERRVKAIKEEKSASAEV